MKIAFATSDGVHLDELVRRASRLDVYELGPGGPRRTATLTFPPDKAVKTAARLEALAGVDVVFGTAFSPSSAARIAARGMKPATAPRGTPVTDLLSRFAAAR